MKKDCQRRLEYIAVLTTPEFIVTTIEVISKVGDTDECIREGLEELRQYGQAAIIDQIYVLNTEEELSKILNSRQIEKNVIGD